MGSLVGVAAGVILGVRVRRARTAMFDAFRAREKPVKVLFEDGRSGEFGFLFWGFRFERGLGEVLIRVD